jgi:hypothetical protein
MMEPRPAGPLQLSSAQVLIRFGLRAVLLAAFASVGSQGFAKTLMSLLVLSAIFCAIVATMRRELLLGPVLTHWDEAAAYAGFAGLVSAVGQLPTV